MSIFLQQNTYSKHTRFQRASNKGGPYEQIGNHIYNTKGLRRYEEPNRESEQTPASW